MADGGSDRQRVVGVNPRAQVIAFVIAALLLAVGIGYAVLTWLEKSA